MGLHIVQPSECTPTHGMLSKLNGAKSMVGACLVILSGFFFPHFKKRNPTIFYTAAIAR